MAKTQNRYLVSGTDYEDEYGNLYGATGKKSNSNSSVPKSTPSQSGVKSNAFAVGGTGTLDVESAYGQGYLNTWESPNTNTGATQPQNVSGANTGSGGGGGGGNASAPAPNYSTDRNTIGAIGNYDPAANAAYQQALAALETARGKAPTYTNSYEDELGALYAQITNREPFRYDLDSDPIYQQYRDQYMMQGEQAMMDTMGQAAALTGGYGSTYSQAVGQQQYNAYLQDLNSVVPDLYNNAYNQWLNSGNELYNRYSITQQAADDEYGKYRDAVGDWWNDVNYAYQNAQQEYNRGLDQWERDYRLNQDAIARQQDDYSRLMELMSIGYTPTKEEIAAAGMSEAEAAAWNTYIQSQRTGSGGGGGGGGAQSVTPTGSYEQLSPAAQQFYNTFIKNTSYSGDNYIGVVADAMEVWGNEYNISDSDAAFLVAAAQEKDKKK